MNPRKWELWQAREGLCDYCGAWMSPCDLACHIHHALVYKSDLPRSKQAGIDESINLMLVHAVPCHEALQSDRQWAWEFKVERYGEDAVVGFISRLCPRTANYRFALPIKRLAINVPEGKDSSIRR